MWIKRLLLLSCQDGCLYVFSFPVLLQDNYDAKIPESPLRAWGAWLTAVTTVQEFFNYKWRWLSFRIKPVVKIQVPSVLSPSMIWSVVYVYSCTALQSHPNHHRYIPLIITLGSPFSYGGFLLKSLLCLCQMTSVKSILIHLIFF